MRLRLWPGLWFLAALLVPVTAARADVASARASYEQAEGLIAQGRFNEAQKLVASVPRTDD